MPYEPFQSGKNPNPKPDGGYGGSMNVPRSSPIDIRKKDDRVDNRPKVQPDGGYGGALYIRRSAPIDIPKKK